MRPAAVLACVLTVAAVVPPLGGAASRSRSIVVTRAQTGAPSGCGPLAVARRVDRLFAALQRSGAGVAVFFPRELGVPGDPSGFQWFVEAPGARPGQLRRGELIRAPGRLPSYFAERRRVHEARVLLMVAFESVGTRFVGLSVEYTRSASDLRLPPGNARGVTVAKAVYDCRTRRFPVWAAGAPAHDPGVFANRGRALACPQPRPWAPGSTVVACGKA